MLKLTVSRLVERRETCGRDRSSFLGGLDDDVKRYCGPYFRRGSEDLGGDVLGDPHNLAFLFVAVWLGRIVHGIPQVDITPTRMDASKEAAHGVELWVNRRARESNLRLLNEQLGVDFLFRYCTAVTSFAPAPGFADYDDPPHVPVTQRVPPDRFLYDAQTRDRTRWRYMGHEFRRDLDDILREADQDPNSGWRTDRLETLGRDGWTEPTEGSLDEEDRGELDLAEFWIPEVTADDLRRSGFKVPQKDDLGRPYTQRAGYHGAIFTIGRWQGGGEGTKEFIREPRMYWGPRQGPYVFGGGYQVPNDSMPLSLVSGTRAQAEHLNTVARARMEAIESYKRIAVVAADDPTLAAILIKALNGEVVPVEAVDDLQKRLASVEVGGDPNGTMLGAEMAALKIVEMITGMGETQRGEVPGQATATAVASAGQATDTRLGMLSLKYRDEVVRPIFTSWGWYGWHAHNVVSELPSGKFFMGGEDRGKALGFARRFHPDRVVGAMPVPTPGGIIKLPIKLRQIPERELARWSREDQARLAEQYEDPFDGLDWVVQPHSMEKPPETVQSQQLQQMMMIASQLMPQMRAFPEHNWDEFVRMIAQYANLPQLPAFLNVAAARKVGVMQFAAMMAQTAGGQGGGGAGAPQAPGMASQPRLGFDGGPYKGAGMGGGGMSGTMKMGGQGGALASGKTKPMAQPMSVGG